MAKKLFSDDDFDKRLSIGDELIFDKPDLTKIRVALTWGGTDLDICAFILGADGMIHEKADLIYFNSQLRWKTEQDLDDVSLDPFRGSFSQWPAASKDFKNPRKWMEGTLPVSADGSVIGSWDEMDSEDCAEYLHINLDEVDTRKYSSIVIAAAVAKDRIAEGETFEDAHNPVVSIYNMETKEMVAQYQLANSFPGKDVVCFGRVDFDSRLMFWKFVPMAEGYKGGMQYLATEVFD